MDIVTEGYLEEFVQNFSVNTKDITKQFEYFANFIVVANLYDANRFQIKKNLRPSKKSFYIISFKFTRNLRLYKKKFHIKFIIIFN